MVQPLFKLFFILEEKNALRKPVVTMAVPAAAAKPKTVERLALLTNAVAVPAMPIPTKP